MCHTGGDPAAHPPYYGRPDVNKQEGAVCGSSVRVHQPSATAETLQPCLSPSGLILHLKSSAAINSCLPTSTTLFRVSISDGVAVGSISVVEVDAPTARPARHAAPPMQTARMPRQFGANVTR